MNYTLEDNIIMFIDIANFVENNYEKIQKIYASTGWLPIDDESAITCHLKDKYMVDFDLRFNRLKLLNEIDGDN